MHASFSFHHSTLQLAYTTQACQLNLNLTNASKLMRVHRDENERKQTKKPHFYFHFYICWRKRDRIRKMWVRERNRDMRVHGNEPIRSEIQRKRVEAENLSWTTAHLYTHNHNHTHLWR
jgi:hypothetical protein